MEKRYVRGDRSDVWVRLTASAVRKPAGGRSYFIKVVEDISEEKRANTKLDLSEELPRLANEAAGIGVFTVDFDASLVSSTLNLSSMLGFSGHEAASLESAIKRIHRGDLPKVHDAYLSATNGTGDGRFKVDFRFVGPGGVSRWIACLGKVNFKEGPSGPIPLGIVGACIDITDRESYLEALRQAREDLDRAQAVARTGSWRASAGHEEIACSTEIFRIFGLPPGTKATLETFLAAVHPDDRERVALEWNSVRPEELYDSEFRIFCGDAVKWVRARAEVECDAEGNATGSIGTTQDITGQKAAEAALRASEERFRGIFEHAATGIAITDLEGRFQSCNPAFSAMLGYSEEELRGLNSADIQHPDDRNANAEEVRQLVEEKIPSFEIVNRYLGKDGRFIWVHKYVSLLRDASGRPTNRIGLITDITERKHQEDRIRLLLSEVNHRSKNMLTVVQAVARQTLAANPQDFLDRFGRRIEALAACQDLLVKNAWQGTDLNELVRSQLGPFEDLIGTRIAIQGQVLFVSAHAAQTIGMALHELATNAGKYGALFGADGRIEITWRLERGERNEAMFVMTWREQSASPVSTPVKLGFGYSVICELAEMSLGAEAELTFPVTGLAWKLRCAATEVLESSFHTVPAI
jgi:PAS domain S-box-containing protein